MQWMLIAGVAVLGVGFWRLKNRLRRPRPGQYRYEREADDSRDVGAAGADQPGGDDQGVDPELASAVEEHMNRKRINGGNESNSQG